jgi:hypothetical protein
MFYIIHNPLFFITILPYMVLPYLYTELDHLLLTSLDFAIIISSYKNKVQPESGRPGLGFMIPSDRVFQYNVSST